MSRLGIRAYLAAAAAVLLVPTIVFFAFALERLIRAERAAEMRTVLETARAVSHATDQKLVAAEALLRSLATSVYLRKGDLAAFHAQAAAAKPIEAAAILLFDPTGRTILTTHKAYGSPEGPQASARFVPDSNAAGLTSVSGLHPDPQNGQPSVIIAVPVPLADGRYVLAQSVTPHYFERVFAERKLPADWSVAIFDRNHRAIAQNPRAAQALDEPGSDAIRQAAADTSEGQLRHSTPAGTEINEAFARSPHSGWLVAVGAPAITLTTNARDALALAATGVLGSIALACALMFTFGRRLDKSIDSIVRTAGTLGRGEPLPPHEPSVAEIDAVRSALDETHTVLERESDARARAEAERLQLFESEQAARQVAEEQNRAKDEFLAMLGHELRNPLSAISGAVGLMKLAPPQDDQWLHAREVIARQTQHLSRVVDDLLDLSRVMTGKVALELAPLDLATVAANCLDTMSAAGRVGAQQVVPKLEPAWVRADATRLEQVIVNLLSNAVKYTPQDGRIELRVWCEEDQAVLCVRDTGLGIPRHLLPHVFEVFVQGEQSLDRAKGGLGIGLALVQRLVTLHGGTVTAESSGDARGSAFTVRLPRLIAPKTDTIHAPLVSTTSKSLRVLVVDDHEDSRTMLRMLLEQTGHEAMEAVDGIDGMQIALSHRPDVAIIDIGLPGIDGYEVARRLRALPKGAQTIMIALTGYGQDEDRQRALQAGFDIHLVKPVEPERLSQALYQATRAHTLAQSASSQN